MKLKYIIWAAILFTLIVIFENCTFNIISTPPGVKGGDPLFDAAQQLPPEFPTVPNDSIDDSSTNNNSVIDSGISNDVISTTENDSGNIPPTMAPENTTWSDLYLTYFGPSGKASCSEFPGRCHGSPNDPGAASSNYICSDQQTCYDTITGNSGLVNLSTDISNPSGAHLFKIIRQPGGIGVMPKNSIFTFQAADVAAIKNWISNGALDN